MSLPGPSIDEDVVVLQLHTAGLNSSSSSLKVSQWTKLRGKDFLGGTIHICIGHIMYSMMSSILDFGESI